MLADDSNQSSDVEDLLILGKSLRRQGRKQDAISKLKKAHVLDPLRMDVFGELVESYFETQQFGLAIEACEQVLQRNANLAVAHFFRGVGFFMRNQFPQAEECFEKAIACDPEYADAYINLGNMLHTKREYGRAMSCYHRAIELGTQRAIVFFNLGGSQQKCGLLVEALSSLNLALQLDPNYVKAYKRLGDVHADLGNTEAALQSYRAASQKDNRDATALISMGALLRRIGRFEEALVCFEQAASRAPLSGDVFTGWGNVRFDQGMLEESLALQEKAIHCSPNDPNILCNYAQVLQSLGRLDESLQIYGKALQSDPEFARAHFNRSIVLLLKGEYLQGFEEYEWRWSEVAAKRPMPCAEWNGEDLKGKKILLHAEQGFGDTLQFVRFVDRVLAQSPARLYLECQPALCQLLGCVPGIELIPRGKETPPVDFHLPLMSLMRVLKLPPAAFASRIPYLSVDSWLLDLWKSKLGQIPGYKIGIVWQGSSLYPKDRLRSVPLKLFSTISKLPGIQLIGLQKGNGTEQIKQVDFEVIDFGAELDEVHGPFMDTAALIHNLDLVITIDSAVVHLSGALGKPTWLLLNLQPDWRWLQSGTTSPWYPSIRIFRQARRNDWETVFQELRLQLLAKRVES